MSESANMELQLNLNIVFWCRHLLSQVDRDPYSPTAGCFDRKYWAWKARDFADATLQYAAVPLLKVVKSPPPGLTADERQYYLDIVVLAAQYLQHIQHRNGSLDQCYPNERHPGVVFDMLPLWIFLLRDHADRLSPSVHHKLEESVDRGISYVLRTRERYAVISNHLAHFAYVLLLIYKYWQRADCRALAETYLDIILDHQSPEGWYQEYGGPDMGYQTRTLSYLARILQIQPDATEIEISARRAIAFLSCFAYPDGSFGGEIGSRNVAIIYPFGLAWFAQQDPMASALLRFAIKTEQEGRGVQLHQTDLDNLIRLFDDQLDAYQFLERSELTMPERLPMERESWDCDYEQAGIVVRRRHWYYGVANLAKGGIYKIFHVAERRLVQIDTGWVYQKGKNVFSNHMQQPSPVLKITKDVSEICGGFFRATHATLSPLQLIVLRLLNLTVWRFQPLGDLAKYLIARQLFLARVSTDIRFERRFYWGAGVRVETTPHWPTQDDRLFWITRNFTPISMASAKYFQVSDVHRPCKLASLRLSSGEQHTLVIEEGYRMMEEPDAQDSAEAALTSEHDL